MDTFKEKIYCWSANNREAIEQSKEISSAPLSLLSMPTKVKNIEMAIGAFEQITQTSINEDDIMVVVPIGKEEPFVERQHDPAFVYPYQNIGWLCIFHETKSVVFLDKNMYDISETLFTKEEITSIFRKFVYRLLLVIAVFALLFAILSIF